MPFHFSLICTNIFDMSGFPAQLNKFIHDTLPYTFLAVSASRCFTGSCDVLCKLISGISPLDFPRYCACFSKSVFTRERPATAGAFGWATRTTGRKKLEMASNRKTRKLLILIYIWRFLHKVGRASLLNTSLRHTLLKKISISILNSTSRVLFDIITVEKENAIKLNYNLRCK